LGSSNSVERSIETIVETITADAGAAPRAAPALSLATAAVAAGFEPAEGCPSRAFEARSLGRSDTPPPERLSNRSAWGRIRPTCGSAGLDRGSGRYVGRGAVSGGR
jgi:hypothetical protein